MSPETAFQSYLEGALETYGIEADDVERAVMAGVWHVYEEGLNGLLDADLADVELEVDLDLSKPPSR